MLKSKEKTLHNALDALHRVLILTRFRAYNGENPQQLARILDDAEYLVVLLMRDEDNFSEFRAHLQGLGEKFPDFAGIVEDFDKAHASLTGLPKTA